MSNNNDPGQSGILSLANIQDTALNVVWNVSSIICRPVEMILRPQHGSRYYTVPVIFISTMLMIVLPVLSSAALMAVSMIPFTHFRMPSALFDIGSLSKLYFLLSFAHGFRIWRRMLHMELEQNSTFEGPPLPFFNLLPKGQKFWFTRCVWEPLFVFVLSMVLGQMLIITPGLSLYLKLCAFALFMKSFCAWYKSWEYVRTVMDMRFAGPIIAKLSENQATESDLAPIHLAGFPKNLPEDIRRAAVAHIARTISPDYKDDSAAH
jgi:hypothetical protein